MPEPLWALVPAELIVPPIANEGSKPAACKATVSMAVVVVFPCVPATATEVESDNNQASAVARGAIGNPAATAASNSGLFLAIAAETIIRSAPFI
ncbi:unannotated protein [freshwater metagenome]|uniref:Unannotated protein n=1 Tax=freshwater metagenome TaxID=449393 RepID=A0A6J6KTK1_9ZZZZ